MMEILRLEAEWSAIRSPWNDLLSRSASDYPFLRWEYQRAWWAHRGGGEQPDAELRIGLWRPGGVLRGIAPLLRVVDSGSGTLRLIGSREISDYLDVICAPEDLDSFCEDLLDTLARLDEAEWQTLDLHNLHSASHTADVMGAAADRRGWRWERKPLEVCPTIRLADSWDAYLDSLEKKQRHEVRRKLRRAESEGRTPVLRKAAPEQAGEAMQDFLRLMALDPRKEAFLTPAMRGQFRAIADATAGAGILQLAFLEYEDKRIAGFFNFDYRNRIWVYNSGMDPAYAPLSPGWVLLALLIQDAIRMGREEFDFMRGNEPYKFLWGGTGEPISQLTIQR
jgi:CelD/BcsL family acetyltransferase involved in cellulose biosynthesis